MNRHKQSNEFKLDAVRLAERGNVPARQVARDLGFNEGLLHKWINQFGKRSDGSRVTPAEREELIRLRRELRIVKAGFLLFGSESSMGIGYHLCMDAGGLAVSGCCYRLALSNGGGLVNE